MLPKNRKEEDKRTLRIRLELRRDPPFALVKVHDLEVRRLLVLAHVQNHLTQTVDLVRLHQDAHLLSPQPPHRRNEPRSPCPACAPRVQRGVLVVRPIYPAKQHHLVLRCGEERDYPRHICSKVPCVQRTQINLTLFV